MGHTQSFNKLKDSQTELENNGTHGRVLPLSFLPDLADLGSQDSDHSEPDPYYSLTKSLLRGTPGNDALQSSMLDQHKHRLWSDQPQPFEVLAARFAIKAAFDGAYVSCAALMQSCSHCDQAGCACCRRSSRIHRARDAGKVSSHLRVT